MSADGDGDDGGPGRREVAHRVFAAEFDDATVSYRESDEERAPNYVVTPTGLRANRLFAAGVLTEVENVNDEVVRARVADPTGAFVSYAGQYQPDALAFLERTDPPAFVALTGKARTFEPEDGDRIYTSVRPESVNAVDADTRDRWVVGAAEATLERVAAFEAALATDARGGALRDHLRAQGHPESLAAGIPLAIERYGTTRTYLEAVRRTAVEALELVAGRRDAVDGVDVAPDEGGAADLGPTPALDVEAEPAAATADGDAVAEPTGDDATGETSDATDATGEPTTESAEPTTESPDAGATEPSEAAGTAAAAEPTTAATDSTDGAASGDDAGTEPLGDFDAGAEDETDAEGEMYELDEEERREVREEFGTEFSTGSEVDDPGEADIDVPDPEDVEAVADDADDEPAETVADDEPAEPATDEGTAADDAAGDVDLEDAVVDAMADLDDGDGADREAVVASVVDAHGADPADVEDAIQDALMSGRCYEPGEDTLKPI